MEQRKSSLENMVSKNPKMLFLTCAYQAENTIARTIESVLAQTYSDFTYIIIDNGCTDKTAEIIKQYAAKDKRVRYDGRDCNSIYDWSITIREYASGFDYFAFIDADDEYEPWFLKKALEFAREHNLDIVTFGYTWYDSVTNKALDTVAVSKALLYTDNTDRVIFSEVYEMISVLWASLYKASAFNTQTQLQQKTIGHIYSDTCLLFELLAAADRFAILPDSACRHFLYPSSHSSTFDVKALYANSVTQEAMRKFLIAKNGCVSEHDEIILYDYYIGAVYQSLYNLAGAGYDSKSIEDAIRSVFSEAHTQKIIDQYGDKARKDIYAAIGTCFVNLSQSPEKRVRFNIYKMYEDILNSTSWRITAPLRKAVKRIRGSR